MWLTKTIHMKTYKLMIKTHTVTGLNYLCMTSRQNWVDYAGSGVRWTRHLNAHGKTFTTTLLIETESYPEFLESAIHYSEFYDVVANENFANAIPEHGYDNKNPYQDKCNFAIWWDSATEEQKKEVYEKRGKRMRDGAHWVYTPNKSVICDKLSTALSSYWFSLSKEEQQLRVDNMQRGMRDFFNDNYSERFTYWKNKISSSIKLYHSNLTDEGRRLRGAAISKGRYDMTDEAKQQRGIKIGIAFSESKSRADFIDRMKTERVGEKNPAAKVFTWFGTNYPKHKFKTLCKENGYTDEYVDLMFNTRTDCNRYVEPPMVLSPKLMCPHCNKCNDVTKKISTFKRWHFENCKMKEHDENKIN